MGALAAEGLVLVGNLYAGGNRLQCAEPMWMILEVVHWDRYHRVKDLPWLL